jgi:Glycosyltransferase family 87
MTRVPPGAGGHSPDERVSSLSGASLEQGRLPFQTLVAGLAGLVSLLGLFEGIHLGLRGDWLSFYAAGRTVLGGQPADLYDPQALYRWQSAVAPRPSPWFYPPGYAWFFAPLSWLSPAQARVVWLAVGLGALCWAVHILREWCEDAQASWLLALVGFLPLTFALSTGQMTPITLLLFAAIARWEWRGQLGLRAGFLAGAALYKPQLLAPLIIVWIARRRWRALLGFGAAALVVLGLSLSLSVPVTLHYLAHGAALGEANRKRLEARGASAALVSLIGLWALPVALAAMAALIVAVRRSGDRRVTQAMLWLAPIIVTPYLGTYDMLLVALPISFLLPRIPDDRLLSAASALVWFAPLLWLGGIATAPVVACVVLFAACAWRALRPHSSPRGKTASATA